MWITGTFKDINNKTITVDIRSEKTGNNINIDTSDDIFFSADPITISTEYSDTFTHIVKKQATINLVSKVYLGDYLWAANEKSIIVNIYNEDNEVLFAGYVTPNTYSQGYAQEFETITINCRDFLSAMGDMYLTDGSDYDTVKMQSTLCTFKDLLELLKLNNKTINLKNYTKPMDTNITNYTRVVDGFVYEGGKFYLKMTLCEELRSPTGEISYVRTDMWERGEELIPDWRTTTDIIIINNTRYYEEEAYVCIEDEWIATGVKRPSDTHVDVYVVSSTKTYGSINSCRRNPVYGDDGTTILDYMYYMPITMNYTYSNGETQHMAGWEFVVHDNNYSDGPVASVYVYVYYNNAWHETRFSNNTEVEIGGGELTPEL